MAEKVSITKGKTTRTKASVDVIYEISFEAVLETIVNACTHRSYTSNGSVQVELYPDRLEVSNPGTLPYGFTIEQLTKLHNSVFKAMHLEVPGQIRQIDPEGRILKLFQFLDRV